MQGLVDWKQDTWEDIKVHFLKDPEEYRFTIDLEKTQLYLVMFVKLIFETVSSNFCKVEKNTKSKQNFWSFHEKKNLA